jgi:putative ABC transport system permease protein
MGILGKKLRREIVMAKGQWIAVIVIVAIGLIAFNSSYVSFQNLNNSKDFYYAKQGFADLWFYLEKASPNVINSVAEIKGVETAAGRISLDVSINLSQSQDRVYGRIHSYDMDKQKINKVHIVKGYFPKDVYSEILLEKQFAELRGIKIGDKISAVYNGERHTFIVSGLIASPEYIYPMRSGKDLIPNPANFAIMFASPSLVKSIWGKGEGINEVLVVLKKNADEDEVIKNIENKLQNYRLFSTIKRKNQPSNLMLNNELKQLENMAIIFPLIFLGVSAIIIYIVLKRIIENQRSQIGLLKALGFSKFKTVTHYLSYGILVCITGGILGGTIGQYLGVQITEMYTRFFNIPFLKFKIYWSIFLSGIFLSLIFALLGGWQAVKRINLLTPAQALRPAVPVDFKKRLWLEKITPVWEKLSLSWHYALRNLLRNNSRTFITISGITISVALMISTVFFLDALDFLLNKHFKETQDYELRVILDKHLKESTVLKELENNGNIQIAEPYLEVPVKAIHGWQEENLVLVGIKRDSKLYNIYDNQGNVIPLSDEGIILSQIWQKKLGISKGDIIKVKPYAGDFKEKEVRVQGFTKQYMEFNGFMLLSKLNELIGEEEIINNVLLKVEYQKKDDVRKTLMRLPNVSFVETGNTLREKFEEYLGLTYLFLGIIVSFGGAIAVSIVYVTNSISLLERRSELALLRTVGYSNNQLADMVFKENTIVNLLGIVFGFPLGRLLAEGIAQSIPEEIMVIPVIIYPRTYLFAGLVIIIFMFLLRLPNIRFIKKLNLVEVLKDR